MRCRVCGGPLATARAKMREYCAPCWSAPADAAPVPVVGEMCEHDLRGVVEAARHHRSQPGEAPAMTIRERIARANGTAKTPHKRCLCVRCEDARVAAMAEATAAWLDERAAAKDLDSNDEARECCDIAAELRGGDITAALADAAPVPSHPICVPENVGKTLVDRHGGRWLFRGLAPMRSPMTGFVMTYVEHMNLSSGLKGYTEASVVERDFRLADDAAPAPARTEFGARFREHRARIEAVHEQRLADIRAQLEKEYETNNTLWEIACGFEDQLVAAQNALRAWLKFAGDLVGADDFCGTCNRSHGDHRSDCPIPAALACLGLGTTKEEK